MKEEACFFGLISNINSVSQKSLLLQRFNPYLQYLSVPLEGAEVSRPNEQKKKAH